MIIDSDMKGRVMIIKSNILNFYNEKMTNKVKIHKECEKCY